MSLLGIAGGIFGGGLLAALIYLIHRAFTNAVNLDERDAAIQVDAERIAQMDTAAAAQRAERAKDFDAKAASALDADGASGLLRDVTGAGHPPTN